MTASQLPDSARILVIKTHAIGDYLMTTPAIRDLREAHPHARISLLIGSWSAGAARGNPHLDEIIEFDDRVLLGGRRWAIPGLLWRLRRRRFDAAVIFHASPFVHFLVRLMGIPRRFGLVRAGKSRFLTRGTPEILDRDYYYALNYQEVSRLAGARRGDATPEGYSTAEDEARADALLSGAGIRAGDPFVLVAPGGSRNSRENVAARRWPAEKFAELLRLVRRDHPDVRVILTGARGDAAETGLVGAAIPDSVDLTARTSLPDLFCLARRARAVIANDSSLLHIAMGARTPAIVPFGPTGARERVPAWALPYTLQSDLPCSPCYVGGDFPGCDIGIRCMRETSVSAVYRKVEVALAAEPPVHSS